MTIQRGDFVRPKTPRLGLPQDSVWRVICADGPLKLEPENASARSVSRRVTVGCRFPAGDFDKVVLCRGQWVSVRDEELLLGPTWFFGDDVPTDRIYSKSGDCLTEEPMPLKLRQHDAVATATIAAEQAASAAAATVSMLEAARKLEAERQQELREAKAAKAKADKEAAARAKVEEARKALDAKLYADRCLGEATLALIAEVSRLNNGGSEQIAEASIAAHVDQLQALAKSYGYRIVKPGVIAIVVKA